MINVNHVIKSYTGRTGCMCGCRGNYRVASAHLAAASAERGYAYDASEVSDRSVKIVVNKLNRLIDWADADAVAKYVTPEYAYFETDNDRTLCVYFAK